MKLLWRSGAAERQEGAVKAQTQDDATLQAHSLEAGAALSPGPFAKTRSRKQATKPGKLPQVTPLC